MKKKLVSVLNAKKSLKPVRNGRIPAMLVTKDGKSKRLTGKERKFVLAKVKGDTNVDAYKKAGYAPMNRKAVSVNASQIHTKPHIQQAIQDALALHEATPEFAVGRLKAIAEQDKEIGASRLASKDILELHGWRKEERPNLQVSVKNAFFNASRKD